MTPTAPAAWSTSATRRSRVRLARASGRVHMNRSTLALIRDRKLSKGDVLEVARLAGIMAAKRTGDLIPLCHPLPLDGVHIEFSISRRTSTSAIQATARATARTGVEMEALTAVSVAALDDLRHVQGGRSRHGDRTDSVGREIWRRKRPLQAIAPPSARRQPAGSVRRSTRAASAAGSRRDAALKRKGPIR